MRYLRQNTAIRLTVGPFLDKTDGVTPKTALTVTNCRLTLSVDTGDIPTLSLNANATASGGSNDMVHISGDTAGFYDLELTAAQLNYVGRAILSITDATTHCPVFHEFMILPANVYDSLLGADNLQVDTIQVSGTTQTARDLGASVLLSSGTGAGQVLLSSGAVTCGTNNDKTGYSLSASGIQAIWDALTSAFTTIGSIGKKLADWVIGTTQTADVATAITEIGLVRAKTDNLPADPASNTQVNTRLATVDYVIPPTVTAIRTEMDTNSTKLANLDATVSSRLASSAYTAPDNSGITAVKTVTDKLNTAMELDASVYRFTANALELAPSGSGGIIIPVMDGSAYTATATSMRDVSIIRGDSPYVYFNLGNNYTGWEAYFGAKENLTDVTYAISVRQATWVDISQGTGYIKLSTTDTAVSGTFFAEIELRNLTERYTAMKFNLIIKEDVIK